MRASQIAPGSSSCLPHLRLNVNSLAGIHPTTDYKYIPIRQSSISWIPATVVHVRQPGPGSVKWAIDVSIGQADPAAYVPASYQQCPISEKSMTRAEDVRACLHARNIFVCCRIPESR